jgi:protein-S-isoprenylcysteine O-methyltransferase Ste14
MFFLNLHEASLAPKCLFLGMVSAALTALLWMMFPLMTPVPNWFEPYLLNGDPVRRGLVFMCLAVYVLRVTLTILLFLKRKFIWFESLIVSPLMTFVILVIGREGGANSQPLGLLEFTGLALYFTGSFLNTWSEFQRQQFKSDPTNLGRLYTYGLFRISRNINYFGDVVLFSGLALVTGRFSMLVIPLFMGLNFVLFIIPRKEAYLAEKYGSQFSEFRKKSKTLIPYLF